MKKISLYFLGLAVVVVSGCQNPSPNRFNPRQAETAVTATNLETVTITNRSNPELLQPSSDLFTLGPGDKIEIELLDVSLTRTATLVEPDGKIYFNLLPGLDVWGLT